MHCTTPETIKAARKAHVCSWCGQRINAGDPYSRWRCYDGSDTGTVRMHPECNQACSDDPYVREEGGEFELHANERPSKDASGSGVSVEAREQSSDRASS